jgi:exoribonuclease R
VLGEGAASLLPDGDRPAVIFTTRADAQGNVMLAGAERAIIRSRAKLAYDSVRASDLPPDFADFANRITAAEDRRGATRVDPPQQEVARQSDGSLQLGFAPRLESEDQNAALSLATNLAIADALQAHATGLFRVMAEPDDRGILRLRHTARAFGLVWPDGEPLAQYERTLVATDPRQAAFMLAIRRAGHGAGYEPYQAGRIPWHSAMAATYAHATAPLRRLADRYVVRAALAIANGEKVPAVVSEAFAKLPPVMARAEALEGQIQRAVIDVAEALLLEDSEGETFAAVVTDADERGARIQLRDEPVVARVAAHGVEPGDAITVRLTAVDAARRTVAFELAPR